MKMNNHQIPITLKIVAVLFIFSGIMDVLEMAISLTRGQFIIKFGFLGLSIGNQDGRGQDFFLGIYRFTSTVPCPACMGYPWDSHMLHFS
jgi:hypothetical protein